LPFKDNGAAKDFYFRAREKETRIVFNVTGGKKIGLSHEPLIKNIPERVLFLIRGFDVASYFSKWKNILPIKINDEDFDILSGKGELLVMAGEETRPPEFLLVIQKSLSEEEMARLESFIKKGIAEFLPREEKIILPDGEEAAELLADPASFGFSSDGAFKFLEARDDFQFAYGQIEKEGRSFLLFSNSLEHLKQFISFGDFSDNNLDQNITRDCFGRFFQENKVSLYLNPEFLMPYSGFLPNFSKILFNNVSDKVCILKYTPSPF